MNARVGSLLRELNRPDGYELKKDEFLEGREAIKDEFKRQKKARADKYAQIAKREKLDEL
jgi:hypothetical protein